MPYIPKPPPNLPDELRPLWDHLEQEFQAISREFLEATVLELREIAAEPLRPRNGMIVFADGTDWDPGSGRGLYVYDGGWEKITHV